MFSRLKEILDKHESEFIYNVLEIENSSRFGQSAYRFWYNDFRENLNSREGDIYEFGVYRGSSLLGFAFLAKRLGSNKHFWGFDSFSGFQRYSSQDELKNLVRKIIGPIASPDIIHFTAGLPKTRSGKIMRRILRKIAANEHSELGDITTLADPSVIKNLIESRLNK